MSFIYAARLPAIRHDVEGAADITEELLRIHGYDNIPYQSAFTQNLLPSIPAAVVREGTVRRTLALRQLTEARTWSFMDGTLSLSAGEPIRILNPIASDMDVMRKSILPNLLSSAANNIARAFASGGLFEVGPVFHGGKPGEQYACAAAVRWGNIADKDWSKPAKKVDAYDAKSDLLAVLKIYGVDQDKVRFKTEDLPSFLHPYKSAEIIFANKVIGWFGEIHPLTLKKFGIKNNSAVAFEINLDMLPEAKGKRARKTSVTSDLQPVSRDFAFVFEAETKAADILREVRKSDPRIADAYIFDIYAGAELGGKKSIAVKVGIQPTDTTLTDEEIGKISDAIIAGATKLGGVLRG